MRKIKILDLYGQALGLNGEEKNITAFGKRLEEMGYEYEISEQGVGDEINTEGFDIVFMTHGKPCNIAAVSEHFTKYKEHILSQIEAGQPFVVTGSATMLMGKGFRLLDGKEYPGLGLMDCRSEEFDGLFVGGAVLAPDFAPEEKVYGVYYRFADVIFDSHNEKPLFKAVYSYGMGGKPVEKEEGLHYKNLFASWSLGPLLARNPVMMREVLKTVLKEDYKETDFSLEEKAVGMIISELMK